MVDGNLAPAKTKQRAQFLLLIYFSPSAWEAVWFLFIDNVPRFSFIKNGFII